jgi:hypothetical protein
MPNSPTEVAAAAIERLRTLREHAKRRREQSREAVRQVRERNRQESLQVLERVKAARRPAQPWPTERPVPQMNLYDTDEADAPQRPAPPPPPPARPATPPAPRRRPVSADDDDWSQETWLH